MWARFMWILEKVTQSNSQTSACVKNTPGTCSCVAALAHKNVKYNHIIQQDSEYLSHIVLFRYFYSQRVLLFVELKIAQKNETSASLEPKSIFCRGGIDVRSFLAVHIRVFTYVVRHTQSFMRSSRIPGIVNTKASRKEMEWLQLYTVTEDNKLLQKK